MKHRVNSLALPAMFLLFVFCVLQICACSSGSETEDDIPVYTPGDGNTPNNPSTDGDNQTSTDGDEAPVSAGACKPICDQYCNLLNTCTAIDGREYAECLEMCSNINIKQTYSALIACGQLEDEDCAGFTSCKRNGGNEDFLCDPGTPPVVDGDQPPADIDLPVDGDPDEMPPIDGDIEDIERGEGWCASEQNCPLGQHCNLEINLCVPECDPIIPTCPDDQLCKVILNTALSSGSKKGMCVDPIANAYGEGEVCHASRPCQANLICGKASRCEIPCNPNNETACTDGLRCQSYENSGVSTCTFCSDSVNPCDSGLQCLDGYCSLGAVCTNSADCENDEACFHGHCGPGCSQTGCERGTCDDNSEFCYEDICAVSCPQGECCDHDTCGPCCQGCGLDETCRYTPSCQDDFYCCDDRVDCRLKPEGFCRNKPCDPSSGVCLGLCLEDCPWGWKCDASTKFRCKPESPEYCDEPDIFGDVCDNNCQRCAFGDTNQCVATNLCGISCIPDGVSCSRLGGQYLSCCGNSGCCMAQAGKTVCCPPEYCVQGVGCSLPGIDDSTTPSEYDCPECDALVGSWCRDSEQASCPERQAAVTVSRASSIAACWFRAFEGTSASGLWIAEFGSCDSQSILSYDETGYEGCHLYWDNEAGNFVTKCKNGSTLCESRFTKEACAK